MSSLPAWMPGYTHQMHFDLQVMVVAVTPWADFLAKLEKRVRSRLDFKMVEVPMPRYQPEFEFGAGRAEEAEDEQEAAEDGIEREAAQHGVGTTMYVAADRPLLRIEEVARDMLVPAVSVEIGQWGCVMKREAVLCHSSAQASDEGGGGMCAKAGARPGGM